MYLNYEFPTFLHHAAASHRKDREAEIRAARTDDMKEGVEGSSGAVEDRLILQDPSVISLTPAHLQTLATVAQSPEAIHLMLDSGFPLLLVHGILGKVEGIGSMEKWTVWKGRSNSDNLLLFQTVLIVCNCYCWIMLLNNNWSCSWGRNYSYFTIDIVADTYNVHS